MLNKLYEKIKTIFKENFPFFVFLIVFFFLFNLKFPYYINTPGGLIDVNDRIEIDNSYNSSGSLNLAYVTEIKATIPTLLYAKINKDWDIIKKEEVVYENESEEDVYFRDRLLLDEANNNAIIVGFTKANKSVQVNSSELIVTYIDLTAKTDLKIGDSIISMESVEVKSINDISAIIQAKNENDIITIEVTNNGATYYRTAQLKKDDDKLVVGVLISEKKQVVTTPSVKLKFKNSESGPSGGFMTALSIYNSLTETDITNGLKIVGTGTIDSNGNVGMISGIKYKLKGAVKNKADIFFVPIGSNYEEAISLKEEKKYDIDIIGVANIDEAINYLMDL